MPEFISEYLKNVAKLAEIIDQTVVEQMVDALACLREKQGRLFLLGVGGSAANCSHAVNDFRKLCGIEAYTPVDNVSELTARTNDDGWDTVFSSWLSVSHCNEKDVLFVFSVGGGDELLSPNLVKALKFAKKKNTTILGIVGRNGGYTKKVGDIVLVIPTLVPKFVTPYAESFQSVIWHCIVSHPKLQKQLAKWESLAKKSMAQKSMAKS